METIRERRSSVFNPAGHGPVSLILDALSRAERDRRRAQEVAGDLLAEHGPTSPPAAALGGRRLVMAGLVLAIAAGFLWMLGRDWSWGGDAAVAPVPAQQPAEAASAAVETAPRNAAASAEQVLPAPGLPARSPAPDRPPGDSGRPVPVIAVPVATPADPDVIAQLYARGDRFRAQPSPPPPDAQRDDVVASVVSPQPAVTGEGATRDLEPGSQATDELRDETPLDLEQVLRRARAEAAAAGLSTHPAPLLQTLNQQYRDRVPTLMYLRHDYHPAATSTVLINGETLRVGGRSRGVEVREILADSVILSFEGREFRLRALNSWVNL